MNCIVHDYSGAVMCLAVLHEFIPTKDGPEWASLTNKKNGQLFYATVERIRHVDGREMEHDLVSSSTDTTDDEFVETVMEFLASGAKSIEQFHYMDKAHKRRIYPNPAWFK